MDISDDYFMAEALKLAKISYCEGEVPVGAAIIKNKNIIAVGRNRREGGKNSLYHAEIEAINNACKVLGGWRLLECEMFVTLEPCPMCMGAVMNSRIKRLVFGTRDLKSSSYSDVDLFAHHYNYKLEIKSGILEKECSQILTDFFKKLRSR